MDNNQIEIVYSMARSVRDGNCSRTKGAKKLQAEVGISEASAQILIYVYCCMAAGIVFKRALSSVDLDYLLEQILAKEGKESLATALDALIMHISYREGMGVSQRANRRILQKYEAKRQAGSKRDSADEFVPVPFFVGTDGKKTLFLPNLITNKGFKIGTLNNETFIEDYWTALATLCEMPVPVFWRPDGKTSGEILSCSNKNFDEVKRSYLVNQLEALVVK